MINILLSKIVVFKVLLNKQNNVIIDYPFFVVGNSFKNSATNYNFERFQK